MTRAHQFSRIPRSLLAEAAAEVGGELEFFAVARVAHEPEAAGAVDLQGRCPAFLARCTHDFGSSMPLTPPNP